MGENWGRLYICATPIGNLGDITLRVLETLRGCDYVAAEDTRHTLKLLNHFEIKARLISYYEHNEVRRSGELIDLLKAGKDIALVSDAGMPLISDPGAQIIRRCADEGILVTACPGASASLTALALSGLPAERFVFEGFLPKTGKERAAALAALLREQRTTVIYESPHRLRQTLGELYAALGNRRLAILRELTKIHEECLRVTLEEAVGIFAEREPKGEFVLVLEGASKPADESFWEKMKLQEHVDYYTAQGLCEMDAIKKAARDRGLPKNAVYRAVKTKATDHE